MQVIKWTKFWEFLIKPFSQTLNNFDIIQMKHNKKGSFPLFLLYKITYRSDFKILPL